MIAERKRVLNKITSTMEQNSTMVSLTEPPAVAPASCSSSHITRRGSSKITDKYSLRPRTVVRRLQQVERTRDTSSFKTSESKASKSRPPPLSKYRRKTANARERHRMKEINEAFETLRRILPDFCSSRAVAASTMTKITTLRLAASYIRALSHILEDGRRPGNITFLGEIHLEHTLPAQHMPQPPTAFQGNTNAQTLQTHTSEEPANLSPLSSFSSSSFSSSSSSTNSSPSSSSTSSYPPFSHLRCSFGSSSDLSDLLSDDSCCVLDDNLDLFDDIPPLPEADPFALLLAPDGAMQVPDS